MKPVNAVGSMTAFSKVPVAQQSSPRKSPERLKPGSRSGRGEQPKEAGKEQVDLGICLLNRTTNLLNRRIKFELPSDSNKAIVKIVDQKTGEVIRQLPPAESVRLRERIKQVSGRMLKVKT
jgi:flagellar protein FlaG